MGQRWDRFKRTMGWPEAEQRFGWDEYAEMVNMLGHSYALYGMPTLSLGAKEEEPERSYDGFATALFRTPIVYGCMERRRSLFSEARLQWKNRERGNLFGTQDLALFEEPWPNGSTGDLLSAMEQDVSLAGNWFGVRRGKQILRLKPDWTVIVLGGQGYGDPAAVPVGYLYYPGGANSGSDPIPYGPEEVAHYAPTKDPQKAWRGISWLNSVLRDITADKSATTFKQAFLEGGAVPNTVVKADPQLSADEFRRFKEIFLENHAGAEKYSTIFLGGGSDIQVIGENLGKGGTDLRSVQAHGENRICIAAGVPAIIVGAAEGLEAATYSNFASAKRQFVDNTMRPLWRSAMAALQTLVPDKPGGAVLWYDEADIPFLSDTEKERAEVMKEKALAAKALFEAGYEPESAREYIETGDPTALQHTGMPSVQTFPDQQQPSNGNGTAPLEPEPQEET